MYRFPELPLDPPEHREPPHYAGDCAAYVADGDVEVIVEFDKGGAVESVEVERPWVLSPEDWSAIDEAVERATSEEARAERAADDEDDYRVSRAEAMADERYDRWASGEEW